MRWRLRAPPARLRLALSREYRHPLSTCRSACHPISACSGVSEFPLGVAAGPRRPFRDRTPLRPAGPGQSRRRLRDGPNPGRRLRASPLDRVGSHGRRGLRAPSGERGRPRAARPRAARDAGDRVVRTTPPRGARHADRAVGRAGQPGGGRGGRYAGRTRLRHQGALYGGRARPGDPLRLGAAPSPGSPRRDVVD